MQARRVAASLLLVSALSGICCETNITLFTLPINLTSWRMGLHGTPDRSLVRNLGVRLTSALNGTLNFLRNSSVGCTPLGEQCVPEVPSCCPSTVSGHVGSTEDEDLQCLPQDGVYRCSLVEDSEDAAQMRLNALEYGDSAGQLESHPWVNSWEFQSKSEGEREELAAKQDDEFRKNFKPSSRDNVWQKVYSKVKKEAIDAWKDLRKMKKLKELKDSLIAMKNKRLEHPVPPEEQDRSAPPPATRKAPVDVHPADLSTETHGGDGRAQTESEESVIKFSDEQPKRDKKIYFRLGDIIKDVVDLAGQKFKKNTKENVDKDSFATPAIASEEELLRIDQIQGTVDKLRKEVDELKALKAQQEEQVENRGDVLKIENKVTDDLIKKHVRNILEEKRRLYELRKIEEAKRLKQEDVLKT